MEIFAQTDTLVALLTLTFLEIILGIDNIIFISIATSKLPQNQQKKASQLGLLLAMMFRIFLLMGISYLISMNAILLHINNSWISTDITGQSVILFGVVCFYSTRAPVKSTTK